MGQMNLGLRASYNGYYLIWKILCLTSFFYEKYVFFNYSPNLQAKSHILVLKLTSFNKKR